MPIYEYRCNGCGDEFEFLKLPSKTEAPACPSCAGVDLERLPTGFAVSSDELRMARVQKARELRKNSSNYKDQKIAEAEHIREHVGEHRERVQNEKP
ncbi:MAG: zinc ribbon domain-containing protein [Vicinamibacterales bacterium]